MKTAAYRPSRSLCLPVIFATVLLVADGGSPALSRTLTAVTNPWPAQPGGPGEWNLFDNGSGRPGIMEYIYGAGSFERADDTWDPAWRQVQPTVTATAIAVFAGAIQQIGFRAHENDVLLGTPFPFVLTPPSTLPISPGFTPGDEFLWLDQVSGIGTQYSDPLLNGDRDGDQVPDDQMVTFQVTRRFVDPDNHSSGWIYLGPHTYVIAFEGANRPGADLDFNDVVAEVDGCEPSVGTVAVNSATWGQIKTVLTR